MEEKLGFRHIQQDLFDPTIEIPGIAQLSTGCHRARLLGILTTEEILAPIHPAPALGLDTPWLVVENQRREARCYERAVEGGHRDSIPGCDYFAILEDDLIHQHAM